MPKLLIKKKKNNKQVFYLKSTLENFLTKLSWVMTAEFYSVVKSKQHKYLHILTFFITYKSAPQL